MIATNPFRFRLTGLAIIVLLTAFSVSAATITVNNTSDSGAGSLREAIATAANGDTINFSLPNPSVITVLTPLTFVSNVTIVGPGASRLAIDGGAGVVAFIVNGGGTVAITGLTIQNGSQLLGGGIFNAGTLTLTNVFVRNNEGQLGGRIFNSGTLALFSSDVLLNKARLGAVPSTSAPAPAQRSRTPPVHSPSKTRSWQTAGRHILIVFRSQLQRRFPAATTCPMMRAVQPS
jgi:hypothetical protein